MLKWSLYTCVDVGVIQEAHYYALDVISSVALEYFDVLERCREGLDSHTSHEPKLSVSPESTLDNKH